MEEDDQVKETKENPSCITIFEDALTEGEEIRMLSFIREYKRRWKKFLQMGDVVRVDHKNRSYTARNGNHDIPHELLEFVRKIDDKTIFNNCMVQEYPKEWPIALQPVIGDLTITFVLGGSKTLWFVEGKKDSQSRKLVPRSAIVMRQGDYKIYGLPESDIEPVCTMVSFRSVNTTGFF